MVMIPGSMPPALDSSRHSTLECLEVICFQLHSAAVPELSRFLRLQVQS